MNRARSFHEFHVDAGRVEFSVETLTDGVSEGSDRIWIDLGIDVTPRNDLLAVACATVCGQHFSRIEFDIDISEAARSEIALFTEAEVIAPTESDEQRSLRLADESRRADSKTMILNFSGGFDSLALLGVMPPEHTVLISVDWGFCFEREVAILEKFDTHLVTTNLRELGYNLFGHEFMGIGAILLSDHYAARYNVFGTILESIPQYWDDELAEPIYVLPYRAAGLETIEFASGLTEVGTAVLALRHFPDRFADSLVSLSDIGTEKHYRKLLLARIARDLVPGRSDIELPEIVAPVAKPYWGKSLLIDVLALYIAKHLGPEALDGYITHVPRDAYALADRLELRFMERFNTRFDERIPSHLLDGYKARLAESGILPYDDRDTAEFFEVARFIHATRRDEPPAPETADAPSDTPLFVPDAADGSGGRSIALTRAGFGWMVPLLRPAWGLVQRIRPGRD